MQATSLHAGTVPAAPRGILRQMIGWARRLAEQRRQQREIEQLARLDEHTLRDIGLPAWALEQATAQRAAQRRWRDAMLRSHAAHRL
jgi:uncharacterized protein YjiS (DUF1127 family)